MGLAARSALLAALVAPPALADEEIQAYFHGCFWRQFQALTNTGYPSRAPSVATVAETAAGITVTVIISPGADPDRFELAREPGAKPPCNFTLRAVQLGKFTQAIVDDGRRRNEAAAKEREIKEKEEARKAKPPPPPVDPEAQRPFLEAAFLLFWVIAYSWLAAIVVPVFVLFRGRWQAVVASFVVASAATLAAVAYAACMTLAGRQSEIPYALPFMVVYLGMTALVCLGWVVVAVIIGAFTRKRATG